MRPELIVFDLDGTLVDSAPDLAYCIDATLESLGLPPCGHEQVRRYLGNGAERFVKRALTGEMWQEPEPALYEAALARFLNLYGESNGNHTNVYPGVHEALRRLQSVGISLCVLTNKKRLFTEPLLKAKGLQDFFGFCICGDDLATQKPDPGPLLHAMRRFEVSPSATWMIGDSATDVATARAAGVKILAVSYGYNHGRDIREAKPDGIVDSLLQICTILHLAA
ncbi:MAG TPA: phosphoglycolate phosphatase [Gammaproteobacteria bacterium]|nr:phosphoglycolate phosphatase [Gammaproteobacteria bacterium]